MLSFTSAVESFFVMQMMPVLEQSGLVLSLVLAERDDQGDRVRLYLVTTKSGLVFRRQHLATAYSLGQAQGCCAEFSKA